MFYILLVDKYISFYIFYASIVDLDVDLEIIFKKIE